jgi:hypothetical protein
VLSCSVTWSTGEDLPADLRAAAVTVDLEPQGPRRDRQLQELRRSCSPGSTVVVRHRRRRPWLEAVLQMADVFHGPGWSTGPSDDEQQAFLQCAAALAPTGAGWSWRSV